MPIERGARDLTLREAAELVGVSTRTIRRLIERGHLQPVATRPLRVSREAVEVLLALWKQQGHNPFANPRGRPKKNR